MAFVAMLSSIVSYPVAEALEALQEIDEVYQERLPDGRIKVVFVTSGVHPTLAKIKTWLWSIFGVPIQKIDEYHVEELQRGPVIKRYRLTVVLKPLVEGIRKDRSLGLREALFK
jgi:hypothetical protein